MRTDRKDKNTVVIFSPIIMKNSELNGTEFKTMLLNTRNGIYLQGLYYCSILSGVIRGALEIVNNTNIFC